MYNVTLYTDQNATEGILHNSTQGIYHNATQDVDQNGTQCSYLCKRFPLI